MNTIRSDSLPEFQILVNDEEQHALWPLDRDPPAGWTPAGISGSREACLVQVAARWTDIRPLSLRRALAGE